MKNWFYILIYISAFQSLANEDCTKKLATFDSHFQRHFSLYPTVTQISNQTRSQLLKDPDLPQSVREYLAHGGNPLTIHPLVTQSIRSAFTRLIGNSSHSKSRKEELLGYLNDLFDQLENQGGGNANDPDDPSGGGGGGNGGSGEDPPPEWVPDEESITASLNSGYTKSCIKENLGSLLIASTVITSVTAFEAHWDNFGDGSSWVHQLANFQTVNDVVLDRDFLHNVGWNLILMATLGVVECLPNQMGWLGRYLIQVGVAMGTSVVWQLVNDGEVSVRQTLLDTLFIATVTKLKLMGSFKLTESLRRSSFPMYRTGKFGIFLVSEGIGGYTYPRALIGSYPLWEWLTGVDESPDRKDSE